MKRKVILITDGDVVAKEAVEEAARNINARCITRSAGNPTPLSGQELVDLIKEAERDPVVVMVDDRGHTGMGKGEKALDYIMHSPDIEVLGVIAVASNTKNVRGVKVDCSVSKDGKIVKNGVDKYGNIKRDKIVKGDTVDILNSNEAPFIIGIGDPGKMEGHDNIEFGAPIVTKAMEEILQRSKGKI